MSTKPVGAWRNGRARNPPLSGATAAGLQGEHADALLGELGYHAAAIARLRTDGVV